MRLAFCSTGRVGARPATAFFLAMLAVAACSDAAPPTQPPRTGSDIASVGATIVVTSSAELVAALSPANAGRHILVRAGTYDITAPMSVPDSATLEGEGVMRFDGAGLPTGFDAGAGTTLRMTVNAPGNVLTLGDGAAIRGLAIADLPGRLGNVVAVVSRAAGDRVSATIQESEIVNPNAIGAAPDGPAGYGLIVLTRNPNLGAAPLPHEGAVLAARMERSLIRSPGGGGVFAFNFASAGSVSLAFAGNVVGGGLNANGGVSRPDAVHDAAVAIESHGNLYRDDDAIPCAARRFGFNLTGGSGPPAPLPVGETARNTLLVQSVHDRIEGFPGAIIATGARRFFPSPTAGPSTGNRIDLQVLGGTISTPSCAGAQSGSDLQLEGAFAGNDALFPGDGNSLRVDMRGVTGSGLRQNLYADAAGPGGSLPPSLQGSGNRLIIVGSPEAFAQTNRQIDPAPAAVFFTARAP